MPRLKIKIFGTPLSEILIIPESADWNAEGRTTSWLRIILYMVIVFLVVILTLLLGKKFSTAILSLIPSAVSIGINVWSSIQEREWKEKVMGYLEGLDFDTKEIILMLQASNVQESLLKLLSYVLQMLGKVSFI